MRDVPKVPSRGQLAACAAVARVSAASTAPIAGGSHLCRDMFSIAQDVSYWLRLNSIMTT
jgi:hypothetical protein